MGEAEDEPTLSESARVDAWVPLRANLAKVQGLTSNRPVVRLSRSRGRALVSWYLFSGVAGLVESR
jgi:hypothetical protein